MPSRRPRTITREPADGWLLLEEEDCPLRGQHTPHPSGYLEHAAWAERKMKTHVQKRCAGCHRWAVWVPRKKATR